MNPEKPMPGRISTELRGLIEKNRGDLAAVKGNIFTALKGNLPRSLVVISSSPSDGRTITTACLGCALSASQRILLIDGCLARPRLHELFNLPRAPGLTDCIQGQGSFEMVVQSTELPQLQVLTAGQPIANTASILNDPRVHELILHAQDRWDCVVCDTPPYLGASDAPFLAQHFDGALLVIDSHRTRWEVAQVVKQRFIAAQGQLIGVVINRRRYYIPSWFYRFL